MSDEKDVPKTGQAATAEEAMNNPYLADALERKNRLRAILDGLPKFDRSAPPLTPAERRAAALITVEGLEQAALFAEEEPNVGGELADVPRLRDTINYILAYEGVREQALFLLDDLDQTILRLKRDGAKYARGLYRVAKVYALSAPVKRLQSKVAVMKQTLGRPPRRREPVEKPEPPADTEAVKK